MRRSGPFQPDDRRSLEALYDEAHAVIAMEDVWRGNRRPDVIAVRHDVDDNQGSFEAALKMAAWEAERGYRSTYFLLHTASYWSNPTFRFALEDLCGLGHEIGLHVNGLAEAFRTGRDPHEIVFFALEELRRHVPVVGVVAHGDEDCYEDKHKGTLRFVNDEQFVECARTKMGAPDRRVSDTLTLEPRPLADFGLLYDANHLPRRFYASDSGTVWSQPWEQTVEQFRSGQGQLHLLIHPDWWTEAF